MREKFNAYLDLELRVRFFQRYRQYTQMFPASEEDEASLQQPCRDPRDNKFLALALSCSASLIIASDRDLLDLNPWQGIPILTPAQFLH